MMAIGPEFLVMLLCAWGACRIPGLWARRAAISAAGLGFLYVLQPDYTAWTVIAVFLMSG